MHDIREYTDLFNAMTHLADSQRNPAAPSD
jgi:hypothetical protein